MVVYCEEFFEKKFVSETMKDAYMKAAKWVASNVISRKDMYKVKIEYEKREDKKMPTITVHLFVELSASEVSERHCEICMETHNKFFINENCNCAWCNSMAFMRRANKMLKVKADYYKEKLKGF